MVHRADSGDRQVQQQPGSKRLQEVSNYLIPSSPTLHPSLLRLEMGGSLPLHKQAPQPVSHLPIHRGFPFGRSPALVMPERNPLGVSGPSLSRAGRGFLWLGWFPPARGEEGEKANPLGFCALSAPGSHWALHLKASLCRRPATPGQPPWSHLLLRGISMGTQNSKCLPRLTTTASSLWGHSVHIPPLASLAHELGQQAEGAPHPKPFPPEVPQGRGTYVPVLSALGLVASASLSFNSTSEKFRVELTPLKSPATGLSCFRWVRFCGGVLPLINLFHSVSLPPRH